MTAYVLGIVLVSMAGLYVWALAAFLHTPLIRPLQAWLRRRWRRPLIACPWCSGFWLSLVMTLVLHASLSILSPVGTPFSILAAAGIIGLIGSNWTQGAADED